MSLVPHLRHIDAGELSVAYYDAGDPAAEPVVLLHGFPYDVHSYVDVAPLLVEAGFRVIVPALRGHGRTRFLAAGADRSGQRAALGADLLHLPSEAPYAFADAIIAVAEPPGDGAGTP